MGSNPTDPTETDPAFQVASARTTILVIITCAGDRFLMIIT
ncbi:hypothetical protein [Sphaerisporangium corydalis]|uniref:Uncharacterized protein n=1 Tax=Sphaerisporangium corydalis TaxID=1441875 RepID=A0ABV9EI92_9ACTN|nr:hypothetical protein [Sphaerisporangium corydalis]